jgi:hypothetical protein
MLLTLSVIFAVILFLAIIVIGTKLIISKIANTPIFETPDTYDSQQFSQEELKQINESFEK